PSLITTIASSTMFSSSISLPFKGVSVFFGKISDFIFVISTSFIIYSPLTLECLRRVPWQCQLRCHILHRRVLLLPYPDLTLIHVPIFLQQDLYRLQRRPCRRAVSSPSRHRRRDGHLSMNRRPLYLQGHLKL